MRVFIVKNVLTKEIYGVYGSLSCAQDNIPTYDMFEIEEYEVIS